MISEAALFFCLLTFVAACIILIAACMVIVRRKEKLLQSERHFRELFENIVDICYKTDADGNFIVVSPSSVGILGYSPEELIGTRVADLYHDASQREGFIAHLREQGHVEHYETEVRKKNGMVVWLSTNARKCTDGNGRFTGVVGIARDITRMKTSEKEKNILDKNLRQKQKMESIGTLAGGIAHDFNNILAAIIGYAEIAQQRLAGQSSLGNDIRGILRAADRAKELIRHILIFSRRATCEPSSVAVHLAVKEAINLLRASVPSTLEIKPTIRYKEGMIYADPTEIHQITLNLCSNAIHAMEENGTLKISLDKVILSDEDVKNDPGFKPGPYVLLSVQDTGSGIEPENVGRIFEPFFTTKEAGEGTGLGLAVVHGIVHRLDGRIFVESKPGFGTVVKVYLPEGHNVNQNAALDAPQPPGGHEHIMFVDDEPIVIDVTRLRLEKLGYRITTYSSSENALEHFRARPDTYDLVMTDQTMPKITGEQLSKELLAIRPDIPIILCTGYSAVIDAEKAKKIGIREFIMKPFDKEELANVVRSVLDGRNVPV